MEIDSETLIDLIRQQPVIWDKTSEDYKSRNLTKDAWREVCSGVNDNFEDLSPIEKDEFGRMVTARWANVRDSWMRTLKPGGKKKRKYLYHKQMLFLSKIYNINEPSGDTATSDDEVTPMPATIPMAIEATQHKIRHRSGHKRSRRVTGEIAPLRSELKVETDDFEKQVLSILQKPEPDPYSHFFNSILPSVSNFTTDERLDFQMGVLNLIVNIRQRKTAAAANGLISITRK